MKPFKSQAAAYGWLSYQLTGAPVGEFYCKVEPNLIGFYHGGKSYAMTFFDPETTRVIDRDGNPL